MATTKEKQYAPRRAAFAMADGERKAGGLTLQINSVRIKLALLSTVCPQSCICGHHTQPTLALGKCLLGCKLQKKPSKLGNHVLSGNTNATGIFRTQETTVVPSPCHTSSDLSIRTFPFCPFTC